MFVEQAIQRRVPFKWHFIKMVGLAVLVATSGTSAALAGSGAATVSADATELAKSSYICSPSGFGRKSKCYRR